MRLLSSLVALTALLLAVRPAPACEPACEPPRDVSVEITPALDCVEVSVDGCYDVYTELYNGCDHELRLDASLTAGCGQIAGADCVVVPDQAVTLYHATDGADGFTLTTGFSMNGVEYSLTVSGQLGEPAALTACMEAVGPFEALGCAAAPGLPGLVALVGLVARAHRRRRR